MKTNFKSIYIYITKVISRVIFSSWIGSLPNLKVGFVNGYGVVCFLPHLELALVLVWVWVLVISLSFANILGPILGGGAEVLLYASLFIFLIYLIILGFGL